MSLLTALSGLEATELREGEEAVPIELIADGTDELDLVGLRNVTVFGQSSSVALQQVADIDVLWDFGLIKRKARRRVIQVSAHPMAGVEASDVQKGLIGWVEDQDFGPVTPKAAGELADSAQANANLLATLPYVAMIIALLLMFQFNDVRKTFINLAVLPFSMIGVTIGLLVFDSYFGFITLLAIISLFGIVLNNGNVLLDRIGLELDLKQALGMCTITPTTCFTA